MFSWGPDRAPVPGNPQVPPGLALLPRLLGLCLLTPLLSQVGAQRHASRLFFFFFNLVVSWRGAWVFVLLLILTLG